jgi:hypothetical protein
MLKSKLAARSSVDTIGNLIWTNVSRGSSIDLISRTLEFERKLFRGDSFPTWSRRRFSTSNQQTFFGSLMPHDGFLIGVATESEHQAQSSRRAPKDLLGIFWMSGVDAAFISRYIAGECRAYDISASDVVGFDDAANFVIGGVGFTSSKPECIVAFLHHLNSIFAHHSDETVLFSACPDLHRRRVMEVLGGVRVGETAAHRPIYRLKLADMRGALVQSVNEQATSAT